MLAAVALLLGFWVARKARNLIRTLVVQSMPPEKRIEEKAFIVQGRISTMAGIGLMALVAGVAFTGMHKGLARLRGEPMAARERASAPKPKTPALAEMLTEPLSMDVPTDPEELPIAYEPRTIPRSGAMRSSNARNADRRPQQLHYLQVHAFAEEENAWTAQADLRRRFKTSVWVAADYADPVPYKVLIGPFQSRAQVLQYKKAQKLQGFPKQDPALRFFDR